MAQYKALSQGIEVSGGPILAFVDGMGSFRAKALDILARNGISNIKEDGWYPQQSWLDSFKIIADTIGPATIFMIGKKVPDHAQYPPEMNNLEVALHMLDMGYHLNHRSAGKPLFDPGTGQVREGIGHYHFEKTGDKKGKFTCNNPYPCDFDRGLIEAMSRRFKPAESLMVKVTHDDAQPCRKKGADSCTYWVEW